MLKKIVALIFIVGTSVALCSPIVSESRLADWRKAGLEFNRADLQIGEIINITDSPYNATPDDDNDDDGVAINLAIEHAKTVNDILVIYFPPGTYHISQPIEILRDDGDKGNIVFIGAGTSTSLNFPELDDYSPHYPFHIEGKRYYRATGVSNLNKGDNTIEVSTRANIDQYDWIYVFDSSRDHGDYVGQIFNIKEFDATNPNILVLDHKASINFNHSEGIEIWEIDPIERVGFENLKIYRDDTMEDENVWDNGSNFGFINAANCWIKGVYMRFTFEHHVKCSYSSHIEITGCRLDNARYVGGGGHGYGVSLEHSSTECLVENNILSHCRHHLVAQKGANTNVFGYNYTRDQVWDCYGLPDNTGQDLCLHGRYPFANLFEGNRCVNIYADDEHEQNGPYNTFLRNHTDNPEGHLPFVQAVTFQNISYYNLLGTENVDDVVHGGPVTNGLEIRTLDWTWDDSIWDWTGYEEVKHDGIVSGVGFFNEISYYYCDANHVAQTTIPDFLAVYDCTWPPIGPNTNVDMDPSIEWTDKYDNAASYRDYLGRKTYNRDFFVLPISYYFNITYPSDGDLRAVDGNLKAIQWETDFPELAYVKIELSKDNGASWSTITDRTQNTGSYNWKPTGSVSTQCKIRISDATGLNSSYGVSDGTFSIINFPTSISSYTVLPSDTWRCYGSTITNGATLRMEPGSVIKMDSNVRITVQNGGKIIANGVVFKDGTSERWDTIYLNSDGNNFTDCIFSFGKHNVWNIGNFNKFENCTFRNGDWGIKSSYTSRTNSWFKLINCDIYGNIDGVVVTSGSAAINRTYIHNNSQRGIFAYNCEIGNSSSNGSFSNNLITNNGTYGIELQSYGHLWLSTYYMYPAGSRICNNGSHEIYLHGTTGEMLHQGQIQSGGPYGGYSDIYQEGPNPGYYIYNAAQTKVGETYVNVETVANRNYWGTTQPESIDPRMYGDVDWSSWLTSSQYPGGAGIPSTAGGKNIEPVLSATMAESISKGNQSDTEIQKLIDFKQKAMDLRSQITQEKNAPENARRLSKLYSEIRFNDPDNTTGELALFKNMVEEQKNKLLNGSVKLYKKEEQTAAEQITGEAALILDVEMAFLEKQYEQALSKINRYKPLLKNPDTKSLLLYRELDVHLATQNYESAYGSLQELKKSIQYSELKNYTPPTFDIIEQDICEALGISTDQALTDDEMSGQIPEDYSLEQNYPNPFNPETTIPFNLPEDSHVHIQVYNILGQHVFTLTDRLFTKGKHKVKFNGKNLSSGMYIIQASMQSNVNSNNTRSFIKKMLLIK